MIELNGMELTIEQVIAVARHNEQVRISEPAKEKINRARAYVDEKLAQKAVIYGLTTGFGKFSDTFVPEQETAALQRNLIISHACGMGAPLPREVVRGAMLLRCNALARGNSGIRLSTLETLLAMLNRGVHPVIPEKGSLGASGDLAPLAHIVLVMLGEGEAEYQGTVMPGKRAMELAGIAPVELAAKEFNIRQNESEGILGHLIAGGDLSLYGLANAVTRHAQDVQSYDRSTELEATGYKIITMQPSLLKRWNEEVSIV